MMGWLVEQITLCCNDFIIAGKKILMKLFDYEMNAEQRRPKLQKYESLLRKTDIFYGNELVPSNCIITGE